jgi:hypothetical protein
MLFAGQFHMFFQILETLPPDFRKQDGKVFDQVDEDIWFGGFQQLP